MAIYLTNSQISKVYFASSDVKAICLQNDSNRIYPNEIHYSYTGGGYSEYTIDVPTGYTTLDYALELYDDTGASTYLLTISQNSSTLVTESIMSGGIYGTTKISSGSLYVTIDAPMANWGLSLTLKS